MDSAPAEIRNWGCSLDRPEVIIRTAAARNRIDILEWLHEHTPGGITAEDCRADNNYALRWAAMNGHVAVLEWLHKCIPGGFTAKDCRTYDNFVLRMAAYYGHVGVLKWLDKRIPGGVTAEDCRFEGNFALHWAARYGCVPVLEWLATKLTLAEFAKCKCENVWWQMQLQVRRESMLALVVAGKREKMGLPPELWELVEKWY